MPFTRVQFRSNRLVFSTSLSLASALVLVSAHAQSILPKNGVVASGAASIRQSGADLSIVQTSPRAIVNWGSFSIGQTNGVTFDQPSASSAILNRVTGSARSTIAGELQANGQVYLVNPNGIAITPSGAVQVGGGFVASTLGIADSDFNKGNLNFVGNRAPAGVANAGSIQAAPGGFVGLIGGTVSNSGVVSVPLGKVAMGSGERATLNLTGDNFLQVAVPTNTKAADGRALVDVSGKVSAAGGLVQLKAATVARAIRDAVNVPGELSVGSARASGGSIILSGGPGGNVSVSGKLAAPGLGRGGTIAVSGRNAKLNHATLAASSAGGPGGSVVVTGANAVSLASTAVDASGATGGGAIRIGGDFHGASDITSAHTTTIDSASTLNASATSAGNGGTVAVWSTGASSVSGVISAQGGPRGGDGGQVETSGEILDYAGLSVNASSAHGKAGTWLVDPEDLTVDGAAATTIENSLNGGTGVTLQTTSTTASGPGNISSGAGDINVDAAISWNTSALLTLSAFHSIVVNAPITISGAGNLALTTNNNLGGTSSGGVLTFTQGAGSVQFTFGPASEAGLSINGTPYTLLYSMDQLQADIVGDGLGGHFALANNLVSTTTFTGAVVAPNGNNTFTGVFEGLGNTISNLTIKDPTGSANDGLFGVSSGTIRDVGLINASVSNSGASSVVGSLVGFQGGGFVENAYATGALSGGNGAFVGGLVGESVGSISNSHATGTVSGGASSDVGGLVGLEILPDPISNSYATGAVSGGPNSFVGGLVGEQDAGTTISNSYATGAVNGGQLSDVGGLVGESFGGITSAYATGAVSAGPNSNIGGLVGLNSGGSVANGYWDTQTTGQTSSSGGGTGLTTAQLQGALPAGFSAPWATGPGLYPFLTTLFPGGVQAVSGIAYKDAGVTPLASGLNGAAIVSADANGVSLGSATTGANGYYYIFGPSGTMPSGANVVAYTEANAATGATNAATYFVSAGAANSSGNNIFGSTLTETTPNVLYSQLTAGLANAAGADSGALAAIAGVSNINIFATGASFTVDQAILTPDNLSIQTTAPTAPLTISQPIAVSNVGALTLATGGGALTIDNTLSTAAGSMTLTGPTVLDPSITTSGGNITFMSPVTLSADTTVDSGAGATTFVSTVDGDHFLTVSGEVVNFGAKVGSITPLAGLDVTGLTNLFGNVTTNGPITFNNAVLINANLTLDSGTAATTFGGAVDSGDCTCSLGAAAGALSFGGALGGINPLGAVGLVSTAGMTLPSITAANIAALTDGSLTLATGAVLTASGPNQSLVALPTGTVLTVPGGGAAVILAAGLGFINDSGSGAIQLTGPAITPPVPGAAPIPPSWQIYSANPADDLFGGLNSNNTAVWNTGIGGTFAATGDRYVFAFQPTITVTSGNLAKTYGQDVASQVASDFTISGLEPGVSGAFLGDSAGAVFSGTPDVTSLGSPARASVAGGPYAITVAQGSFAVADGYTLVLDSAGNLTIAPLPITFSVANATSTYGTAATLGAATLFGVLPGDTVDPTVGAFFGTTQVAIGPRTSAGAYSEEVTALSNPNYVIAASGNAPGTLTIDPLGLTYAVADANSFFGTTPILGPATLFGVLPGDVVDPTVEAFRGLAPVALTPFTPVGRYAELVTAISNPNYRIAPAPNFPGVLTVSAATANPGAPSDPGFLPGLTMINNPAPTEYDVGGYEQVLPHFAVDCNEPPSLPDPNRYSDPDQALRAISQALENYFKHCQNPTQTTIADALDSYAAKLQVLAPRLPPALRNVPTIIADGARRVRAARSRSEAVAVLRQTIAAVHKEIALVLSEDPGTRSRELRDADVIEGALGATSVALVNSGGL